MAVIDSKKLLPPAKSSGNALATQKFLVPISNIKVTSSAIIRASDIKPSEKSEDGGGGKIVLSNVLQIRESVVSIQRLIGSNTALLQQSEERERKLLEKEKFESKEKKLEGRKGLSIPQLKSPPLPRTGFLDAIKRFLFYTLLGAAFVKFGKHIPKILEFSKKLIPAFKFVENFAGNLLNGAVEFIDKGYKAYDKVREISKTIGGEDLQKKFDEFSKQFNTFANLAIIAGMATMGGTDFKKPGGAAGALGAGIVGGRGYGYRPEPLTPGVKPGTTEGRAITKAQREAARNAEKATRRNAAAAIRRGITQETAEQVAKQGAKQSLKSLAAVPIIGSLIGFIIDTVVFREKPSRAAAGAVGSAIGQGIGIALAGGTTFGLGAGIGMFVGGFAGDWIGKALYDTITGYSGKSPEARAQGGQVTRGGRKVSGPARRTIKRVKAKPPKVKPQKTIPGKDVGGKEEIKKLFPYSINPNQKSPLGVLETTSESLKKVPLLGGVMGASLDLVMGQKPDAGVFKKIGYGFGALVQNAIDAETSNTIGNIQKEIVGLAGGGSVPRTLSSSENIGMKIGGQLAKTFEVMMNAKVSETLQAIRQQFSKEGFGIGVEGGSGGPGGGEIPGDAPPEVKAMLEAISSGEGSWDSVNPGTSIPGLSNMTIADARKAAMQKGYSMGGSGAMGKWQQMPEFILNRARSSGLNPDKDKFSPENQTKIARMLMASVYPGGESQLVRDARRDPLAAASKLRGTWPSLPGGSQENTSAKQFSENFARSLQSYQAPSSTPTKGSFASVLPRGNPQFTSGFGSRWGRQHRGIDIGVDANSPVTALQDGTVTDIYRNFGGHGDGVVVTHSDGTKIVYGHVNAKVRIGNKIKKGQIIATVKGWFNSYGNKDNTHLHLERYSGGSAVDPTGYLNSLTSLAPTPTKSNLASGLNQSTSYEVAGGSILMLQKVIIKEPVPVAGGGMISGGVNNSSASTSPITASLYSA
jgi:murein DD-endopeptidase MepM/ murein hydrolase activator NlpD